VERRETVTDDDAPPEFEALLQYLKQSRGFDFTGYKRASLRRRIDKRMRPLGVDSYDAYVDYLEVHPHEFVALFNTILINVTGFFRDISTWTYLRDDVIPQRVAELAPDAPIRIWSAGCASGEEAYSLAILFAELLGEEAFARRVKIYGTDVDEEALQIARQATYTEREMAGVPPEYVGRYFDEANGRFTFRADIRRSVIFGRIDMLHDAPISRLELLTCRNTLMYLNAETQSEVLERFHFALNGGGILVLGRAETLLSRSTRFEPVDRRQRVFRKLRTSQKRERDRVPTTTAEPGDSLGNAALDAAPAAIVVVDRDGHLVLANERARNAFGLNTRDYGRPFQDLEVSYRPVELRTPIEQAYAERRRIVVPGNEWLTRDGAHVLDVDVSPLRVGSHVAGAAVVFTDVTQQRELEDQLRHTNNELEHAYAEVQSTNEELETTNEELQSTIEELETTNEELQSTNEELETMNEELQSTNDELHTVNDEVRMRGDEVEELNRFLNAILTSFRGGVVVVDAARRVQLWNPGAEELWGLREDEVRGVDIAQLDSGLPIAAFRAELDACIRTQVRSEEQAIDAINRRGRPVRVHVTMSPLAGDDTGRGAILTMVVDDPT
jgi:two-component system CheB/CheR fusion protein